MHVFVEHGGVERVVTEAPTHEERAAASQDGANNRHVQVDAGGNVRGHQPVLIEHVGQQQVINMGAMAGNIHHGIVLGFFLGNADVVDSDAVVDTIPQPRQHHFQEAYGHDGHAGSDLVRIFVRLGAHLFRGDVILSGSFPDGFLDRLGPHQSTHQGAAVRQVRAEHGLAHPAEMGTENAGELTVGAFLTMAVFVNHLLQGQGLIELHVSATPMHHDDQEFLQTSSHGPGVGQQQFDQRFFLVRGAPPEQRHRDDLNILLRVFQAMANQRPELTGGNGRLATTEKTTNPTVEKKEGVVRTVLDRQGRLGTRQASSQHLLFQDQSAGQRAVLQYVANRFFRVYSQGFHAVAAHIRPDPQKQDFAEKGQDQAAKAQEKTHKRSLRFTKQAVSLLGCVQCGKPCGRSVVLCRCDTFPALPT